MVSLFDGNQYLNELKNINASRWFILYDLEISFRLFSWNARGQKGAGICFSNDLMEER